MSEKSITRQQPGRVSRAKNERRNHTVSPGVLWSQISCVEDRRNVRIRVLGLQIGNPG